MEHLDVLVVGAGLSGIGAGAHLQMSCPWATFAVFEARDDVGGTWDLFRYPGVRSDSDMYTLGFGFRPWDGDKAIAEGGSILRYIKETAEETGVEKHIRFGHRVLRAEWSGDERQWRVTAELVGTGETVELTCGFLFACTGYYRYDHGYRPEFAGIEDFRGTVVHPQHWPADLDYAGRRVVVIGSGATAITLVPSLAGSAAHVTMLQRSPSYIGSVPDRSPVDALLKRVLPKRVAMGVIRLAHAMFLQGFYQLSKRRPELVKRIMRSQLRRELPRGYDIGRHFTPRYDPWDQRFCLAPNGDLFEAIREGRASVVTDHIERFTPDGIRLQSGAELPADIVVTATGLELLFLGGMSLSIDGEEMKPAGRLTYKGMMLEGVPNLAFSIGYTNASWTLKCELTAKYVCRLLNHMRATGRQVCTPVNDDPTVSGEPIMALQSGYIQRAAHLLPFQGTRMPWQVHQSYLRDYRAMALGRVEDDAMRFTA